MTRPHGGTATTCPGMRPPGVLSRLFHISSGELAFRACTRWTQVAARSFHFFGMAFLTVFIVMHVALVFIVHRAYTEADISPYHWSNGRHPTPEESPEWHALAAQRLP